MIIENPREAEPNARYDKQVQNVVKNVCYADKEKEDDFFIMAAGTRGTGKSTLMLHFYEQYLKTHPDYSLDQASVENIGLEKSDFTEAIQMAETGDNGRFCGNDEANVSGRQAMTKYNQDLLDLYLAIRGLRIFHWWNNPLLGIIDKPFVKGIIKGFIVTFGKGDTYRYYYYYRKKDLLQFMDSKHDFNINKLRSKAQDYAYFKGWFKEYDGDLWDPYMEKKQVRMSDKITEFASKHGHKQRISLRDLARKLDTSRKTIHTNRDEMIEKGLFEEGEDYFQKITGQIKITKKGGVKLEQYIREKHGTKK
jgi:septin family protein